MMRIAIVNHLASSRTLLRHAVQAQPDWQVAWEAGRADEALEACARDRPDLVLMDLALPGKNGAEATGEIMRHSPCPILILTAAVEHNAPLVFKALAAGAMDAVDLPVGIGAEANKALIAKILAIGRIIGRTREPAHPAQPPQPEDAGGPLLVAVGSSTGGPAALQIMLAQLPADFPGAVVIAQHLGEAFSAGLAQWLGQDCRLPVAVARAGDRPQAGRVLLAGTDDHLVFRKGGRLAYSAEPLDQPYRPSVDELFASAALYWTGRIVGVLLTGMGQDGARGLLALRRLGHDTLAQDRESSVIYGMPGVAARFGAARAQMDPAAIGRELCRLAQLMRTDPHTGKDEA